MTTRAMAAGIGAAGILLCCAARAEEAAWMKPWRYRATLSFKAAADPGGEPAALFSFTGAAKEDGSDIRVVSATGEEIPFFIVSAGPGNAYQVAFPLKGSPCAVYYGNPGAKPVPPAPPPRRGLLLEVYERRGAGARSWEEAREVLAASRAGRLLGRTFWPKIWDASHPFGTAKDVVRVYTGWFHAEKPGDWWFGTSSAGPSFLLVDDRLAASWPDWHGPEPFVRPEHGGTVQLAAGVHKLSYIHVGRPGQELAVAAVRPPGAERYTVIPESFFLPLAAPDAVRTEKAGSAVAAGFSWENTNYLRREAWEMISYRFTDASTTDAAVVSRLWRFGDGQTSTEQNPVHTFLREGVFPVTLTVATRSGATDTAALLVPVRQDSVKLFVEPRPYREYAEEFARFSLADYPTADLLTLARIHESYDNVERAYACYAILAARPLSAEEARRATLVAAALAAKTGRIDEAARLYRSPAAGPLSAETRLELARAFRDAGRPDAARTEAEAVLAAAGASDREKRRARILVADTFRDRKEFAEAAKRYGEIPPVERPDIKAADHGRAVIHYLKAGDVPTALEKLDRWAEDVPADRMRGQWTILAARAYAARKEYRRALAELDLFLSAPGDPADPYRVWAAYQTAETYEAAGDAARAKEWYGKVAAEFPGTEAAAAAGRKK